MLFYCELHEKSARDQTKLGLRNLTDSGIDHEDRPKSKRMRFIISLMSNVGNIS